jgi:SNF2 family DNA or RNA helicase
VKSIHIVGDEKTDKIKESKDCSEKEKPKKLSKNESLIEFIKHNPTAKILMFSGFDATFDTLSTLLKKENITFANVQGSNAHINKLILGFELDKYKILFLNARNMGAGLNILSATHIVMYHKMNASLENQIIGRAYRIGRTESLQVIHLLHTNEIDNSYSVIEASSTVSNPTTIEHV